jgi:hypothetical protein
VGETCLLKKKTLRKKEKIKEKLTERDPLTLQAHMTGNGTTYIVQIRTSALVIALERLTPAAATLTYLFVEIYRLFRDTSVR